MIVDAPPALVSTWEVPPTPLDRGWVLERSGGETGATLRVTQRTPPCQAEAQAADVPVRDERHHDEWQVGTGFAWSIDLLQSAGGRRYVPVTVSWARGLTSDGGPGVLRGRLSWGVEVMPLYVQTAPTSTTGVAVSPLVWRWHFVPRRTAEPFAELAFGGLFTADPVPEGTQTANFIAHGAFGLRWRPSRSVALVTAYRFQHISNGNQLVTNPGVNAHVAWLGISLVK